jgi:hypothetical protein
MRKLKGPELKMSELKIPDFLVDLFYDLRDRRLLPLVALVAVAIAAVPFLLGGKADEPSLTASGAAAVALEPPTEKTSSLTVVEARPGLRDYRKRLRDRTPTDPFAQQYTGLPKGAQVQSTGTGSSPDAESSSSASLEVEEAGEVAETGPSPSSGGSSGGSSNGGGSGGNSGSGGSSGSSGSGGKPHLIVFDYAIDARISYSPPPGQDSGQQPEPFVEQRVLPQTPLPGEKAPVVTYMGPGRKEGDKATGKVLLLVSSDVNSISGEHRCVSASKSGGVCQLLEVEPGFPLTFAYGDGGAHYTIKVLSIELVVTGHT